ncbi:MAG: isopeptide-forming domain-containing fimbrial protein [Ruminococcaceae bacterium]|nr:isopeptide-forming domain-containing fimbrial protein [Oscillospiraceae bacterium]
MRKNNKKGKLMNRTKRMVSLVLIMAVFASMAVTAMAAGYSIVVKNTNEAVKIDGKTFYAYKIFEASYNSNTSSIVYSYDAETCLNVVYNEKSGNELIEWLNGVDSNSDDVRAFADHVYTEYIKDEEVTAKGTATASGETATIDLNEAGYYLVYCEGSAVDDGDTITAAVSLTSTTPSVEISPKFDAPTIEKYIKHNEKDLWENVGDNQIGDIVEFKIISTVPDTYNYDSYTYIIHDEMDQGLTSKVNADSDVVIKVNDSGDSLADSLYEVKVNPADGCTFEIKVDILAAIEAGKMKKGDKLHVYYKAELNSGAWIYSEGKQHNIAKLEYSNNPYATGEGGTTATTGETAEHVVYDWTYNIAVNKVDDKNNALEGAKFVLAEKEIDISDLEINAEGVPTKTENLIGLVKITDGYCMATSADNTDNVTYVIDAGSIMLRGLDDSETYYLYEIKAPDGYNMATKPVTFKIDAEYNESGSETADNYPKFIVDETPVNEFKINIVNQAGTQLPTTGGMGTTIFYIMGTILVIGSAVLLVTRRRMKTEE